MKALRFLDNKLVLENISRPEPRSEALVRVVLSGICRTDLEIVKGYAGFSGTLGHEFVGIVEDAGEAIDLIGKRVVGEINAGCGCCPVCLAADARHCPQRTVLGIVARDGAHAEYLSLPTRNLLVVPDNVTDEQAVFAEPLAAAYGVTEQVSVGPDTRVAVIGDGKLGLLCAMSLALVSREVTLIGKHFEKMELAGRHGVDLIELNDLTVDVHRCFDVVVEASGSETGFATALDLVRPRGKIILKSTIAGKSAWPSSRIVVDEITLVGSRCGRFAPALDLLARGAIDTAPLISETFPLALGVSAMVRAGEPGVLKVLLRP